MLDTPRRAACHVMRITLQFQFSVVNTNAAHMPATETKTALLQMRVQPTLKAAAEKAAAEDQRSLTSLIEKLLSDFLRKKGYLKK